MNSMTREEDGFGRPSSLTRLRVEYKEEPLGMDEPHPRFSYRLDGYVTQRTRRIVVSDDEGGIAWDSGTVEDPDSVQIPYEGEPLRPFTRYRWRAEVRVEGEGGSRVASSSFETGFLGTPWGGKWIYGYSGTGSYRPAARLARGFTISRPVRRARLYATALGLYTPYVNGDEVSEDLFTPGWSQYYDHVQYQAYDVTASLRPGENVLAALVGDGWYCGTISYRAVPPDRYGYGTRPLFRANLRIEYEDGSVETIVTDSSWHAVYFYPALLNNDIYLGEEYDAIFDDERWKLPGFEKHCSILAPCLEEDPEVRIVWNEGAPVRVIEELAPVSITRHPSGTYILDFGVNVTGVERIRLNGAHPGAVVAIRHGEMLDRDGTLYRANLLFAKAMTIYTCGRSPGATYSPRFTYCGFRYLEVSGWPEEMTPSSIHVLVLSSEMERTGRFRCSNELVNRLYENIVRGQQGNYLDVPTDCPQRCERLGWTGDAQVFIETAALNFDVASFFTKWLRDLDASRNRFNGTFTCIAPRPGQKDADLPEKIESMGWADAGILCPWMIYRKYGDRRLLERLYPGMRRHMEVVSTAESLPTIGDHLCIGPKTDLDFTARALLIELLRVFVRIAKVLGRLDDAELFGARREKALRAFRERYFDSDGRLQVRSQTACAMAIVYGLAPDGRSRDHVRRLLLDEIALHQDHLTTGFLGTPILLRALTEVGELDVAYRLLEQTSCPSWLYPVTQGATTVWERWNGWTEKDGFYDPSMNSFNHYAFGAVAAWFYTTIAGIVGLTEKGEGNSAYRRFRLEPRVGGSLTSAEATLESPYGTIGSAWKLHGTTIDWSFTVPSGTTAEIVFPAEAPRILPEGLSRMADGSIRASPGSYRFENLRH